MNPNCFKAGYLGDKVWFIAAESYRERIPGGAIVYTLEEAQILATRTEWARRIAHEAKRLAGGAVTPQLNLPLLPGGR